MSLELMPDGKRLTDSLPFLHQLLIVGLFATVSAIAKLPSHLSQVSEALRMIDGPVQGRLQEPHVLGERLARLAFLEANPDQPYGMHLALQSQVFYRMLIDRYVHFRIHPIVKGLIEAEPSKPQTFETRWTPGKDVLHDLNALPAYKTYDRKVEEFWHRYATSYIEAHLKRVRLEKEDGLDSLDEFRTKYHELPKDKKQAFTYVLQKRAEGMFGLHRHYVFTTVFHRPEQEAMWKDVMQDPHIVRKVSSVGASTSHSSSAS